MEKAKYADKILKHYIIMALDAAGAEILPDTYAELDGIITAAIKEAVEEAVKRAKE